MLMPCLVLVWDGICFYFVDICNCWFYHDCLLLVAVNGNYAVIVFILYLFDTCMIATSLDV